MSEKHIDTSMLDKAIVFATKAHQGTERRGKNFPYIIHPMEVVAIISTISNDQELLAAGALHDTVEDCGITIEEIAKEFSPRVAEIVKNESDVYFEGMSLADSWRKRKEIAVETLRNAPIESKIVALGDKLSNMRAIAQDFGKERDKVWDKFHVSDCREIGWYYRSLASALSDLKNENAYKEFLFLIEKVFLNAGDYFSIEAEGNVLHVIGKLNRENSFKLEESAKHGVDYVFDFARVGSVSFAAMRTLIRMQNNGIRFSIINVNVFVEDRLCNAGLYSTMPITSAPRMITMDQYSQSGEGFTATSYFSNDNDSMMKLYFQGVALKDIEIEKKKASEALLLGVPTPICGDIVTYEGQYGITFERVLNKKSFARMLGDDSSRSDELAKIMADAARQLHKTQCNTSIFPREKDLFIKAINQFTPFTEEERKKALDYLNAVPDVTTCLHGDFHNGNIIMTDKGDVLFIDMGDFAYGDPRFDLACFYFNCYNPIEAAARNIYHCEPEVLKQFWRDFAKHYYNLKTEQAIDEVNEEMRKFSGIIVIYYAMRIRIEPWMNDLVHDWFLNKI